MVIKVKVLVVVYLKEKNMNFVLLLLIKLVRQNLVNHQKLSLLNHVPV